MIRSSRYVGQAVGQVPAARGPKIDGGRFLDSEIEMARDKAPASLTAVLEERFLRPLYEHREMVEHGRRFPATVPTSIILYGPPGTSKTQLADIIGQGLGWPVLKIDPSHLLRQGQDRIHAETYRLFNMLESTERVVILLDEFDEFVRGEPGEAVSRMLTTSMLPKLTALSSQRRLVLLLATNHPEKLDVAITRPGRFDLIIPVMPPTLEAKFTKWTEVASSYDRLGIGQDGTRSARTREALAALTYSEFEAVATKLATAKSADEFRKNVWDAEEVCTLKRREQADDKDWKARMEEQRSMIRMPDLTA